MRRFPTSRLQQSFVVQTVRTRTVVHGKILLELLSCETLPPYKPRPEEQQTPQVCSFQQKTSRLGVLRVPLALFSFRRRSDTRKLCQTSSSRAVWPRSGRDCFGYHLAVTVVKQSDSSSWKTTSWLFGRQTCGEKTVWLRTS